MYDQVVRGEVWLMDLETGRRAEHSRLRLALIVSATEFNSASSRHLIVAPITGRCLDLPTHFQLTPPEGGVIKDSYVACDRIYTISAERLNKRMGVVTSEAMREIEQIISMVLGL